MLRRLCTALLVDPADFVIVKDTVIRAVYEKDSYSIHYNAGPHGSFADGKTEQAEYLDMCSFTGVPEDRLHGRYCFRDLCQRGRRDDRN